MKKYRRLLRLVLEGLVAFVLVVMSMVGTGAITVPVSQVASHQASSPAPAVSGAALPFGLSPAAAPVGAWYAPQSTLGPLYGPAASGTGLMPQKRKPGEQADLRTETSETLLNADGTWTLNAYGAPIHYQDAQGKWQRIDTTLIGDTSEAGYAYGNKANGWRVRFAPQAGGPKLVHAQFPGVNVAETLEGAASVPARTDGATVVYPGVLPGVDLQYSVGAISLEETLLLQNAQAPASYTFTYHVPGASASVDATGAVVFTDAKGAVLLVIGSLLLYEADAAGQPLPTAAQSEHVQAQLTRQGSNFQITYTPDHAWLSDPARRFPVALDPTWQAGDPHTNTTSGNIYGDTIDESGNPSDPFYNLNALRIGNADIVGLCCNGKSRAYLKFPINPAPAHVRVITADLAIYQSSQHSGGGVQMKANVIMSAWNATTLTWNNHPTSFETADTANTLATQNNWVHFEVSAAVQAWWAGRITLNGFELQYTDENQPQESFFSDDNTVPVQ